jgi:protein-tyrosine phosphatase
LRSAWVRCPRLPELSLSEMSPARTELHFHLLPAVDDGPRDEDAALALARAALADGTGRVVTTPHVRMIDFNELGDRVGRLRALLSRHGIALEVVAGGELAPDDVAERSDPELELIAQGPTGRRWVLLEAPLGPCRPDLHSASIELKRRGFQTVIAHPERSPQLDPAELRDLVSGGALPQINASSLTGRHGARAERSALALARSGLAFVLASDAHSVSRPPMLGAGAHALRRAGIDPATIRFAVDDGPGQLLDHGLSLAEPFSCGRRPMPASA